MLLRSLKNSNLPVESTSHKGACLLLLPSGPDKIHISLLNALHTKVRTLNFLVLYNVLVGLASIFV